MQDILISTASIHLFQAKIQWIYGAVDDFVIKQLPHIVTWGLSLAYTNRMAKRQSVYENHGSQLGHDLRYVASAVSHTFMAFGDLLDLYKRFVELGGYLGRVSGLYIFSVIIRLFHIIYFRTRGIPDHVQQAPRRSVQEAVRFAPACLILYPL